MSARIKLAVVGGGVAGLATTYHLLEMIAARRASGTVGPHLDLTFIAQLVPHDDPPAPGEGAAGEGAAGDAPGGAPATPAKSEGSGLGGKAMSRSFDGRYDEAHWGMDRMPFYGPMMPDRGTVPHGYHVLWGYPNLRRMLRADGGPASPPGTDGCLGGGEVPRRPTEAMKTPR